MRLNKILNEVWEWGDNGRLRNTSIADAEQAIREAIERAKPNSEMLSTTTNRPETIFGFDVGVRVFEANLLRELGLIDNQNHSADDGEDHQT